MSSHAPDGTAFDLTGQAGAPVVALIHGLGLCRRLWDQHLAAFEGQYQVLTYDLFGHGDSAPLTTKASLTVYSDQLSALLGHVQAPQAAVVGFSIGGIINRRFALDHGDQLSALVILNSPHDRGDDGQVMVEERALKVREQGAFSTFDDALKRWFTPECLVSDQQAPQLVREWRGLVDAESYAQAAWVLANGVRELIAPNPAVIAPTLVMTCEKDSGSTPAMSHAIASEIKGSKTIIIPRLQHLGLMENPDVFTKPMIEFLERTI